MLYEFELGHNIRYSTVTRWFKKYQSGLKKLDDQARSGRPKIEDSGAVLEAMDVNPVNHTQTTNIRRAQHLRVR